MGGRKILLTSRGREEGRVGGSEEWNWGRYVQNGNAGKREKGKEKREE